MTGQQRIAHLDCSTGVSGDKFLGALLDLGQTSGEFTARDLERVASQLAPEASVRVERVISHGVSATSVRVAASDQPPHRRWSDIRETLRSAQLPEHVRNDALRVFEALANAEAGVHGTSPDEVHFHEVGALDSIVDIVGTCAGVHALGLAECMVSGPIAVGGGTVETSHGVLPVPAPATAALLANAPIEAGPATGELTTPTGAALVRVLCTGFGKIPPMTVAAIGYGAGTRDIGTPNVCRIMTGAASDRSAGGCGGQRESVVLLETNVDHVTAEELAYAAERLLNLGALDVWQTPIVMKKGRAAVLLSVLSTPDAADALACHVAELTGSLGVRHSFLDRTRMPREMRSVETPWGEARVKIGAGRVRPEHDDVARIARQHALPYSVVARRIADLAEKAEAAES